MRSQREMVSLSLVGKAHDVYPLSRAMCGVPGCWKLSEPRKPHQLPEGWLRNRHGTYVCADCRRPDFPEAA